MSRTIKSDFDFGPFEDDYRGFDLRDDESNRGPLILALALGVLLVFGAVVWNTYRQGVRGDDAALPVIAAPQTPYKSAPTDRGGAATPDLDARIYDQIDGSTRPVLVRPVAVNRAVEAPSPPPQGDLLQGGPPADIRGGAEDIEQTETPRAPAPQIVAGADALGELGGAPQPLPGTEVAALTPTLPVPDPGQTAAPTPEPALFAFERSGNILVQISALRSEDAAERAWRDATGKTPHLYIGADKLIQRADLGAKGVFYRLRVGAFNDRAEAGKFCDALKSSGQQCMIVAR